MFRSNSLYRRYFKKIRPSVHFLLFAAQSMFRADGTPGPAQMRADLGQHEVAQKD